MDTGKKRFGIVMKLVGMSALPVVALGIILTVYGQANLKKSLKNRASNGGYSKNGQHYQ